MLGQQLTKEEVEDFMREADVVSGIKFFTKVYGVEIHGGRWEFSKMKSSVKK